MSQKSETPAALPTNLRSNSYGQVVRQLLSWWPYLFIVISVAGFAYILWQQSQGN